MSKKRLSRHDDRPGSRLGLVFFWDLVPAVDDYLESDADLSPEDWDAIARQVGADVDIAHTIPDLRRPMGPVEDAN